MSKLIRALIDIATALNLEVKSKGDGKIEIVIPADVTSENSNTAGYGTAVRAIMESDMDIFYKNRSMGLLKKGGTSDYYEAVIAIVENSDDGFWTVNSIRDLA